MSKNILPIHERLTRFSLIEHINCVYILFINLSRVRCDTVTFLSNYLLKILLWSQEGTHSSWAPKIDSMSHVIYADMEPMVAAISSAAPEIHASVIHL